MWKVIAEWLLAFVNMARELQEHRTSIRELERRTRDIEEALKLLAQEQRHAREIERAEREKLTMRLEAGQKGTKSLPHRRKPR